MTSAAVDPGPVALRATMAVGGAATVLLLSSINTVDYAVSAALSTLGPDVERTLRIDDSQLSVVALLTGVFFVFAAVPVGRLSDRFPRPAVIGAFALLAAAGVGLSAVAGSVLVLGVARVITGAGQSEIQSVHLPLLADAYPESGRPRVFALHTLGPSAGNVLGPLAAGALAFAVGGPTAWRWPLAFLALISGLLALGALRLPEPRAGRATTVAAALPLRQALGELSRIATFRVILVAIASLGAGLLAVPILLGLYFERVQHLGALGRGVAISFTEVGSIAGISLGALLWERAQRTDTTWAVRVFALALALSAVLLPAALRVPAVVPAVALIAVAKACQGLGLVPLYAILAAIVPARLQALAFAALGVSAVVVGGVIGAVVGGGLSDAHGPVFAMTALSLVGGPSAAGFVLRAATTLPHDLDPVAVVATTGRGLVVHDATVSREGRVIVRDVSFAVAPGEVLALLGTNGAGKSTLLRALSGLLPMDSGQVVVDGHDVTFERAPARVRRGLVQVPGGQAGFGAMSALDNLLVGMHTFGWDRGRQEDELVRVLELLPELRPLLDTPAGLLSGGEQQILALAKSLLLRPSVLLIDELSLGLAPVVVGRLLSVVEQVRDLGAAVVLVEQSLNVAASVADRAVFLDRGEIVFEGAPADLLERDDLARAIFLRKDLVRG